MGVHPQVAALLERASRSPLPPYCDVPPVTARRLYRDSRAPLAPDPPPMEVVQLLLAPSANGPVPLRHYRPRGTSSDERLPALVYFHGGGWVIGDLDTHDVLCRTLAASARCAVLSVEYRKAPEAQFPAAVDDSFAALQYVASSATTLGIDPGRVAVGGDSAGGTLATVTSLLARDAGGPAISFQLLIYPVADMRLTSPSMARNGEGYLLTARAMQYFRSHYLPRAVDWLDWRASPLLAPTLAKLPPALVLTVGYDPLVDEGRAYAKRLVNEGVTSEHVEYADMVHGFITMGRVLDTANAAVDRCARALTLAWGLP